MSESEQREPKDIAQRAENLANKKLPKIEEKRFDSLNGRVTHQDDLESFTANWTMSQDSQALSKQPQGIRIPANPAMGASTGRGQKLKSTSQKSRRYKNRELR